MVNLYDLKFLIPLILLKGKERGIREGMVRFQITKIVAWLFVNSEIRSVQKNVFLYKYGPYVLKFEDALADLLKRNILETVIDGKGYTRFCITDEGQRWVMSRLRDQNYKKSDTLLREIDRILFIPISDLIIEIAEKSPLLLPVKRTIGDKELIKIFDWTNFGDGKIHGYHYTLLRSFYRLEDYFDNEQNKAEKKIEEGTTDYLFRIIDYSIIPEVMHLESLFKDAKEKYTMRYIFSKQDPRSMAEDKLEGKNYIGHLWYIYSAINIIHVLAGLAPTIDEVARICLTHYEYAIKEKIAYSKRRKMRERAIRSDIQKLVKYGILNRRKIDKVYLYSIKTKNIIDYTQQTYSLLDARKITTLYEEIRPSPASIDVVRQIRAGEIAIQMGG